MVVITASPDASQRTKNRIREHGPEFKVRQIKKSVLAMDTQPCVSVESPDGWFGWLPLAEVNPF